MDALPEPLGLTAFHQRSIVGLLVVGLIVVAIGSWYLNHPNRRRIRHVGLVVVSLAVVGVVVFGAVWQRSVEDGAGEALPARFEEGRRILEPYLTRWPDDPEAWFILAKQQYHHPEWMGLSADEVLAPFDRLIALDSTFAMAYVHPVQIAVYQNDRELAEQYLAALRAVSGESERVQGLERIIGVCFSERESESPDPEVLERCSSWGR